MSKFAKLQGILQKKGYSKESAGAIAASVGRKKYGQEAMKKSAAAHKPAANFVKGKK